MKVQKAVKYAGFTLGVLLALVLAISIFLVATLDMNKLKAELAQVVQEKKQRTLKIEGDLAFSFWPSLGVKLGKTTLTERQGEQVFAALDSAHISVAILPLLKKQVVIETITLSGVNAAIVRHADGSTNIDDLLEKDKDNSQTLRFDITTIKLNNASLTYRDEKSGQTLALTGLSLSTGKLANAAEGKLELAGRLTSEQARHNADIKLTSRYHYDLDEKRYAVTGLGATMAGEVYGLQGLALQVAVATLDVQPAKGEMTIAGLAISSKGKVGEDGFDVKLEAPKLALTAERVSGEPISVMLKLMGATRNAEAKLSLSALDGTRKALNVAALSLVLDARQGETVLQAALQSAMQADLTALTVDLPALNGELNVAHPRMPMKSVKLPIVAKWHADLEKQTAAGSLGMQFDESKLGATINVSHFTPLVWAFDIDIDKLNIDKYWPPAPEGKATGTQAAAPEPPIDLSALKALNANGSIRIGQLQVANIKASKVRLDIKPADGKLNNAPSPVPTPELTPTPTPAKL